MKAGRYIHFYPLLLWQAVSFGVLEISVSILVVGRVNQPLRDVAIAVTDFWERQSESVKMFYPIPKVSTTKSKVFLGV